MRRPGAAEWWRAAVVSAERSEVFLRTRLEKAQALVLRLREEFEQEWRTGESSSRGSSGSADIESSSDAIQDAPLVDELGIDMDLVLKRLRHVLTLGFGTGRKEFQGLQQGNDEGGAAICVISAWILLTLASYVFRGSHVAPLLGSSVLCWLIGSVFVWAVIVLLSGGMGANRDALRSVVTATGYSSLALSMFLVLGELLEMLTGFAWLAGLCRMAGVLLASRCVGIWIMRIHKMLHKQVLVVYPIVLMYSQML